jgi:putative oxidoreductase
MTPLQSGVFDATGAEMAFLFGRVLFGFVVAFMGLNHFLNVDGMAGYAEAKGLPAPRLAVTFSGGMLLFGGLGIAVGFLPTLAAGALVVFFLVATPAMHDFWAAPEEQQQTEMTQFLKNVVMLGASVSFLALSGVQWPYALGIGLF